jgi:hypothetical protein
MANAYSNLHYYADHTWGFDFGPDNRPGKIRSFTRDVANGKSIRVEVPEGEKLGPGSSVMKSYEESWDAKREYANEAARISDQVMSRAMGWRTGRGSRLDCLEYSELAANLGGAFSSTGFHSSFQGAPRKAFGRGRPHPAGWRFMGRALPRCAAIRLQRL